MTLSYDTVIMDKSRRYTLAELADASVAALDALGVAARNGQVRERPDARTIRYYTALGLVDRPVEMAGRTALYGDRQLLQVLAVKALQARGASLADIQRSLVGASEPELRAAVGPGLPGALTAASGPPPGRPARAFWRTPPSTAPVPSAAAPFDAELSHAAGAAPSGTAPSETTRSQTAAGATRPRQLLAVPLAEGATLLIGDADADAVDAEALRAAAAPLLAHLSAAGLLPGPPTHPGAKL